MRPMRLIFLLLILCGSASVHSKDLTSRLGVGYSNSFGGVDDLPSLQARYYPNPDYGLSGSLGVDTEKDNSKFGLGVKLLRLVFRETNMNFFVAGGAGIISREIAGNNDSGFDASATFGGEFFLPGLESLSLNFEAGVGVTSISSEVRFRTIGDHPLRAGILFYF